MVTATYALRDARARLTPWLPRYEVVVTTDAGPRVAGHVETLKDGVWRAVGRRVKPTGGTELTWLGEHRSRTSAAEAVAGWYLRTVVPQPESLPSAR